MHVQTVRPEVEDESGPGVRQHPTGRNEGGPDDFLTVEKERGSALNVAQLVSSSGLEESCSAYRAQKVEAMGDHDPTSLQERLEPPPKISISDELVLTLASGDLDVQLLTGTKDNPMGDLRVLVLLQLLS